MDNSNNITYEKLMNLEETELVNALKKIINKKTEIDKIKELCITNLLNNNSFFKNLELLNKIIKYNHDKPESQAYVEKIFNLFKLNISNIEKSEKINEEIIDLNNNPNLNNEEKKINLESLKQRYIKYVILFFQIYKCENELNEFLIQNRKMLNKQNFVEFINKIKKNYEPLKIVNLINEILNDIEKNKKPFENKEELELYEIALIELNYLKDKIEYNETNEIYKIRLKTKLNNIEHLEKYFSFFYIQNIEEVIDESIQFLFNLYYSNDQIKTLCKKCKDTFNYSENTNIIKLYKYTIDKLEKEYVLKTHSHFSICKKNIFTIKFKSNEEEKDLKFYGNTTINEIYNYLIKNFESKSDYFTINLINEKEKKIITLDKMNSNKTLNELKKKKFQINISKEKIIPDELYEEKNQKLTKNFEKMLGKWFRYFSKEKNEMNRSDLANCMNRLIKKDIFTERSMKVIAFLKKCNDNKNFHSIAQDKFIDYFLKIFKEDKDKDKEWVLNNIRNMNLRSDLSEIPQEIENDLLPRYYLSNKTQKNSDLYLFDIFQEKYSKNVNEEIFDFIALLSTNEELYNNILNNFNNDKKMKFSNNFDNFANNLYILFIIESIFEDVEIMNNNEIKKYQIYNRDNESFSSEKNNQKKKQFFIDFIEKNYSDIIDYSAKILEKINKEDDYIESKHNLMIRTCSKSIELINDIYISLNQIKCEFSIKEQNIINIEFESFKKIIQENNLNTKINNGSIYENITIQIIIFIDKYYDKYDNKSNNEFNTKISILIKNCYILLFSLLYTNKDLFENSIYQKEENKSKLENLIINKIFLFFIKKNIEYIRILFLSFFKKNEAIINNKFITFLTELSFNILEKYIYGEKNQNKSVFFVYLRILLKKEKLNDNEKLRIIKLFDIFYNYINSNFELKINDTINEAIITFINIFDSNESIKNEIISQKFHEEMTLYDLCINKIFSRYMKNIKEKEEKFKKLSEILEQKEENKFISEEQFIENINEINKVNINEAEKNVDKTINAYIDFCLKSKNVKIKNIINLIISNLKKIKEEEDKDINGYNFKEPSDNQNKIKFKNIKSKRIKKKSDFVGIRNIGTLCFLNSVIQQLYMINQFKYSIMDVDDKQPHKESEFLKDDNMLHQLQKLFTNLSFTYYGEVIPRDLILSIKDFNGKPISPNQMQDSSEFYVNFCNLIEEKLINTKYKYLIQNLFIGQLCNKKICSSCKQSSYNFEDFKSISLEVNNMKNIYDSLNKYISEDNIEDYNCPNCHQKVTLKKYTYISRLPNILIIHLNRIMMNYQTGEQQKINSRFEFPTELDLKNYCIESIAKEEDEAIYPKKNEYYKYNLKGVNLHKGTAEAGHYLSIIKKDKDKWFQFDDSRINEFDFKNLDKECFGGINEENKEEKKKSAYLLFYELSKNKPIKISLNQNEIREYKDNIIEYNNNQIKEIEKKYDISKLNNAFDEKDLLKKAFINKENNEYYKYISYNDIQKNVNKEYLLEVLKDNKTFENLYGTRAINMSNNLIKILLQYLNKEDFQIKDKKFTLDEYQDLISIIIELIISFVSDENSRNNNNTDNNIDDVNNNIKIIANIINKIFSPLIQKENQLSLYKSDKNLIFDCIEEKLFSKKNIKLIFFGQIKEISKEIYDIFLALIENNNREKNINLQESLNKIINEGEDISIYLYKILNNLILKNNENMDEINNITYESFTNLYYKLYKENNENLSEINKIMKYLINEKDIVNKRKNEILEVKKLLNDCLVRNLFDSSIDILTSLIKKFQYNDEEFSQEFNINKIQKLYSYCSKNKDKKEIKEKQMKLMRFIFEILSINDKLIPNRISLLLGYPTLIIKKDLNKNISLFGVSIMNNDINTEIFEYVSYNHIKKERCVLGFLFPSSHETNLESCLDENDRNDLIYEFINVMLGIDREEGNYFLFKNIYLMQTRSIQHDNLYEEMKNILKKANEKNNNKYNLSKISAAEKECISLANYEQEKAINRIDISLSREEKEKVKMKTKPNLPERFSNNNPLLDDKANLEFIGTINDIILDEIGKIEIRLINKSKNLSLFRFEYFTTYFTKKELKFLSENKKNFINNNKKLNSEKKEELNNDNIFDFSILKDKKNEKEFLLYIEQTLKVENDKFIMERKDIMNEKEVKSTLIRYYFLSKNKKILKIDVVRSDMDKDVENNFYLPNIIYDFIEENSISNSVNIHRIQTNYNFLKRDSIGITIKTSNADKYFQENFE